MRTEIINVELIVEVVNPQQYNDFNGELQRACDNAIKQGVMNYVNTNKGIKKAFDVIYQPTIGIESSPNLKFKVNFKAVRELSKYDGMGEYIEFEEIPADRDNNKPIKKKRNGKV